MEIKIVLYIIAGGVYFFYTMYQKALKEQQKKQTTFETDTPNIPKKSKSIFDEILEEINKQVNSSKQKPPEPKYNTSPLPYETTSTYIPPPNHKNKYDKFVFDSPIETFEAIENDRANKPNQTFVEDTNAELPKIQEHPRHHLFSNIEDLKKAFILSEILKKPSYL